MRRNSEFLNNVYTCWHQFTSFIFKKRSKSVRDNWPKVCIVLVKKKQNFLCECTMTPHLYSRFHPVLFRFRGDITEKPLHKPESECNIGSLSLKTLGLCHDHKLQCVTATNNFHAKRCQWLLNYLHGRHICTPNLVIHSKMGYTQYIF